MVAWNAVVGADRKLRGDSGQAQCGAEVAAPAITVEGNQTPAIIDDLIRSANATPVLMLMVSKVLGGLRRAPFVPAVGRCGSPDELERQQA